MTLTQVTIYLNSASIKRMHQIFEITWRLHLLLWSYLSSVSQIPSQIITGIAASSQESKSTRFLSTTFIIKKGKNNICHPPDISKEIRTHCVQSSRDYFANMLRTMTRISPRDATPRQWTKWTNQGAAYRCQLRFHCPPLANIQVYLSNTHKRLNQSCNHHHTGWNPLSRVLSTPWHNPSYQLKDIENLVIFEFLLL